MIVSPAFRPALAALPLALWSGKQTRQGQHRSGGKVMRPDGGGGAMSVARKAAPGSHVATTEVGISAVCMHGTCNLLVQGLGVYVAAAAAGDHVFLCAVCTHLNDQAATLGVRLLQPETQRLVNLHLNTQ